ncbi:hypothetical protein MHB77_30625 [Paenibacillus sp. FSL K6-3166]|uniref:hypothetical protein n=1 Tax=Paenibacillus sp. FSL K6-3166 TaxID=2921492 RepID=UPI0030F52CCF
MTENENNYRVMIEMLNQHLAAINNRKRTNYTQYKMPANVWGDFVDTYIGPDVKFEMANSYSTDDGAMFGIYENEKLASAVRGHTNEREGALILRKKSKGKIYVNLSLSILKYTFYILSILSSLAFMGTVVLFFSKNGR